MGVGNFSNMGINPNQYGSQDLQSWQATFAHPQTNDEKKLKKAAQDFEGVFFKQMLDAMDKTVQHSGLLSGGHAEEVFRGMLNQEIAQTITSRPGGSGFGLAEHIYRQMSQQLPKTPQPETAPNSLPMEGHS